MPRYIDVDKIKFSVESFNDADGDALVSLSDVRKAIEQTPTEDVVEVVRCKDCSFYKYGDCWNEQWEDYEGNMPIVKETDFCSYGKRKCE